MPASPGDAFRNRRNPHQHQLADVKAALADVGVGLPPTAQLRVFEWPEAGEPVSLVILDRVADTGQPSYCVHGYCRCIACEAVCYLGNETLEAVMNRGLNIFPICDPCARVHVPIDQPRIARLDDHG